MTTHSVETVQVEADWGAMLTAEVFEPVGGADPDLPTVVLAHGWTMARRSWRPVVEELHTHRGARVVAYDQRGHGRSTMGRARASVRALGDDLATVIAALAPEGPLVLGGHSMGGMTVMAYAGRHHEEFSERVVGTALVATAASLEGRNPIPLEGLVMSVASWAPRIPAGFFVPEFVQGRLMFGDNPSPADVHEAVAMVKGTAMPVIGAYFTALSEHDEIASLARFVDVPTHILVGTKDRLTPVSYARTLSDQIPTARLTVLPGLGHMLMYEATGVVTDAFIDFLDAA